MTTDVLMMFQALAMSTSAYGGKTVKKNAFLVFILHRKMIKNPPERNKTSKVNTSGSVTLTSLKK